MVLTVATLTPTQYDGADGRRVYDALRPYLASGMPVTLSFAGVRGATSSFVNEALVRLLDTYDYADVKRLLQIADVTPAIARLIRDRFESTARRSIAA